MPKLSTPLTDTYIKNLKPTGKAFKVSDGKGLHLAISASGARGWRFRYVFGGVEKMLSLGSYPDVSLAAARKKAEAARSLVANGVDPSDDRKEQKRKQKADREGVFKLVAASWLASKDLAPSSVRRLNQVLDGELLPKLGDMPVATLDDTVVRGLLKALHSRAPATAVKARQYCDQIVKYAVDEGLRDKHLAFDLSSALPKGAKKSKTHFQAVTSVNDLPYMVRCIKGISSLKGRAAVLTCLYTAQRPGVVVAMEWSELNLDLKEWHIPHDKMKTEHDHISPLPDQLVELLRSLKVEGNGSKFVFSSDVGTLGHIHRDSISKVMRENGLRGVTVAHGFRACLRTLGRERLKFQVDELEAQLAHAKKGEVAAAYDRTQFLEERHILIQKWANYLDSVSSQEKVVNIPTKVA